jgi:Tol biopolymer transport system component
MVNHIFLKKSYDYLKKRRVELKISKITLYWFAIFIVFSLNCSTKIIGTYKWGNLRNLGPNINSSAKDEHATFPEHGKTMYFASNREGGIGGYDLYVSYFENGIWSKAQLLPSPINTEKDEYDPFITLDGKRLFFASNRNNEGAYWNCDIFVSEWQKEKWDEPRIYDSIFVTLDKPDWGITITEDFKTLIFSSGREPVKDQTVQIFQSMWLGDRWSYPEILSAPVNSGIWEATPFLTPDGKTLYLNSARGEEDKTDVDIWKFEFIDGEWSNPQLMDGPFFSDKHDYDPCVSPDGKKFYFTSDRDGGIGGPDIYVVEKIFGQ